MKTKLMLGVVLTTTLAVVGADSASAQAVRGIRWSDPPNVPDVKLTILYEVDGTTIPDINPSQNGGYFQGAIRDFSYFGSARPNPADFSAPLRFCVSKADLRTRLIGTTVKYSIYVPDQFILNDSDPNLATTGQSQTTIRPGFIYTFSVDVRHLSDQDRALAVNSLPYIVDQGKLYDFKRFANVDFIERPFGFFLEVPQLDEGLEDPIPVTTDDPDSCSTDSNP
jgi:hypothetical protein